MKPVVTVLYTVAKELAAKAKNSMPRLREGETITQEGLENGVYYRESVYGGEHYRYQYDFREPEPSENVEETTVNKRSGKKKETA